MAKPMEMFKKVDKDHEAAGTDLESAYQAFRTAQIKEGQKAEKRENRYRAVLAQGFVIERIVEPAKIRYFAGMVGEDSHDLELDKAHATSLQGVYAVSTHTRLSQIGWRSENELRLNKPQPVMTIGFEVPGIRDNVRVSSHITRFDWMGDHTEYEGELAAIEWRLPTEEEIQEYAGTLATAAEA